MVNSYFYKIVDKILLLMLIYYRILKENIGNIVVYLQKGLNLCFNIMNVKLLKILPKVNISSLNC